LRARQFPAPAPSSSAYHGNLRNTNGTLCHSGDDETGRGGGEDERIYCRLKHIPNHILALYFVVSAAAADQTISSGLRGTEARLVNQDTGIGICRMVQSEFGNSTAFFLLRLFRDPNTSQWYLTPQGDGDEHAHDFGGLIPRILGYTRDLLPTLRIDPFNRMAIMRKDGIIRIRDYVEHVPDEVTFGLRWDMGRSAEDAVNLDASAICLDRNHRLVEIVSCRNRRSRDGAIRHGGDEREGDSWGDDEKLQISLHRVSSRVHSIVFTINSFSGESLNNVDNASCRLYAPGRHLFAQSRNLGIYHMENDKALRFKTALLMGALYRDNGEWMLRILSEPARGKAPEENVDEAQRFFRENPPSLPFILPPITGSVIDASIMPEPVPVTQTEEDIVVSLGDLY